MSFRHLLPPLPTTPAERFSTMINMLLQAITGRTGAGGLDFWMVQAISRRVIRLNLEIRDLVAALRAGTLRTRRSPPAGLTRRPASAPDGTMLLLPRRFGWLLPLVPIGAPMAGHHYRELLAEPELASLLAASPRLLRSVRSLGWMLGVKVPMPPRPEPPPSVPPPSVLLRTDDGSAGSAMQPEQDASRGRPRRTSRAARRLGSFATRRPGFETRFLDPRKPAPKLLRCRN